MINKTVKLLFITICFLMINPKRLVAISVVRDTEIETYLKEYYTYPIFEKAGLEKENTHVYLVNDNKINAFVTKGQNIFIHTGLILKTDNPFELIGVIAHEAGHIKGGHLARAYERLKHAKIQSFLGVALGGAIGALSGNIETGVFVAMAGSDTAVKDYLKYTRTEEKIADKLGVDFSGDSVEKLAGFLSFMQKLENENMLSPDLQSPYMRTHPITSSRVDYLKQRLDKAKEITPEDNEAEHKRKIKQISEIHNIIKAKIEGFFEDPDFVLSKYKNKNDIVSMYAEAIAYFKKKDFKTAIEKTKILIQKQSKNPYFYEFLGQNYYESGDIDAAIKNFTKAVELYKKKYKKTEFYDPSLLLTLLGNAEVASDNKKNLKNAVKNLNLALSYDKNSASVLKFLSIAHGKLGDLGKSYYYLADYYFSTNKIKEAKLQLKKAEKHINKKDTIHQKFLDLKNAVKIKEEEEDTDFD